MADQVLQDAQMMRSGLRRSDAIERAAIREYCGNMHRREAEGLTANDYGFKSWDELMEGMTDE